MESAAIDSPGAIRELFATLDSRGVASIGGVGARSIGFRVAEAGNWLVNIRDGRVRVQEGFDTADCVLEMNEETLLGILNGSQNPRTAMMSGRLKVSGDYTIATQLGGRSAQ
jgi:putative sterol carrier protein